MTTTDTPERVTTVETSFEILEAIVRAEGCRMHTIADELDLAVSTVHRHVSTLEALEYVIVDDGLVRPGFRFLEVGEFSRRSLEASDLVATTVESLAEETDECAQFMVEEHGRAVYVCRAEGEDAVATDATIGERLPIHACAAGKVVLAHREREHVDAAIERHGLPAVTDETITDRDVLLERLATDRERGYSINDQESARGLKAIGVPIQTDDGRVLGGLSVSGPVRRFQDEESIADRLLGTANELELNIRYADQ